MAWFYSLNCIQLLKKHKIKKGFLHGFYNAYKDAWADDQSMVKYICKVCLKANFFSLDHQLYVFNSRDRNSYNHYQVVRVS